MSQKLPEARLVPKDGADQMAILRGQAADGAKKVGRASVAVGKVVAVLALCGVGLAALGAGIGARKSRAFDDLDRSMQNIRRLQVDMPKFNFDSAESKRLQLEIQQLMRESRYGDFRSYQLQSQELMPEDIHAPATWSR